MPMLKFKDSYFDVSAAILTKLAVAENTTRFSSCGQLCKFCICGTVNSGAHIFILVNVYNYTTGLVKLL